ncbi:MAG: response regulator, partial [Rhodospirillales bacterium]|nr:response regulator [Rhodospirillales bacterium]
LSGAADNEYVHAARDLGATEFLAKPFSAETVSRRILEIVNFPRQFVTTESFFGPDRRRLGGNTSGSERRVNQEKDVTIVYSADKVVKPETSSDVWYFRLPNTLKEKAGGLGMSGPGELPLKFLDEAEEQLQRAALDFTEWAHDYLKRLSSLCVKALGGAGNRRAYFEEINLLAHELRGQGGTFGYPLITIFGKMLYDTTGKNCCEDDNAVEIVKAHIDAMRAVLRDKVSGDGDKIGRELRLSLETAVDKLTSKVP